MLVSNSSMNVAKVRVSPIHHGFTARPLGVMLWLMTVRSSRFDVLSSKLAVAVWRLAFSGWPLAVTRTNSLSPRTSHFHQGRRAATVGPDHRYARSRSPHSLLVRLIRRPKGVRVCWPVHRKRSSQARVELP